MSPPLVTGRKRVKQQLAGLLFLAVLAALVALTVALYQKAFTPVVMVSLKTSTIGNQLTTGGDVKARGLLVGDIREVSTDGSGATIQVALRPEAAEQIPSDARARLLPKTLFGEKFVSLEFETDSSAPPLEDGDVITQDRTETALETEQTLNDLLPLLQSLKPAQLSVTLNALSTALRGRGDQLGENLELVDSYLKEFNPEIAALGDNFGGLADFADNLEAARPDLLTLFDNLSAINRNLVDQEQELNTFLTSTTTFSNEMNSFLRENENRLVRLAADSVPVLQLYAKYSPEFPCLARGLDKSNELIGNTFGGLQPGLHITLEFTEDQNAYRPEIDEPEYLDTRGPNCYGLPNPPMPAPDINFEDGFRDDGPADSTESTDDASQSPSAANDPASALATPAGQRAAMGSVLGPVLGVSPEEVPDLAYLLFGPMARGTEVGLS